MCAKLDGQDCSIGGSPKSVRGGAYPPTIIDELRVDEGSDLKGEQPGGAGDD